LNISLSRRPFYTFIIFTVIVAGITFLIINLLEEWKQDIIRGKKVLTEVVLEKLEKAAISRIDSLDNAGFFLDSSISKLKLDVLDGKLKEITGNELLHIPGIEGGFFFVKFNEFYGYAFPTSPPPIPAFGPPPRSYSIIKEQVLSSIKNDSLIINLHSFDPAIFPLASRPIRIKNKIVGAVWSRIHVERDLPALKLNTILQVSGLLSLAGFLIALYVTANQRKKRDKIKTGLLKLEKDTSFRFDDMTGTYGFIAAAINKLVTKMTEMHTQKQYLEKELYHQDKLATLGKLIAGVAHEVKTPLAIIKTRIQIWQHTLKKMGTANSTDNPISLEDIQLIVNEIDRLTKLVKRLLVFSKPVSDKFQSVNLNKLLAQTISLIQIEERKDIDISVNLDDTIPSVKCDSNAIEQVFINILTNSTEAVKEDIKIIVNSSYDTENKTVIIDIIDNGAGIPIDIQEKIFDPFFTTKQHGAGLGLSIAYEVIKAHKGKIFFSDTETNGTKCTILLPIH